MAEDRDRQIERTREALADKKAQARTTDEEQSSGAEHAEDDRNARVENAADASKNRRQVNR